MLAKITVADYMSEKIVSLTKETDVVEAIKKLLRNRITSAPVFDEGGNLIGMFSEKDAMKVILESAYNQSMAGKVADFMSDEIIESRSYTRLNFDIARSSSICGGVA